MSHPVKDAAGEVACHGIHYQAPKDSFNKAGKVIVGVLSDSKNLERRQSIRSTWSSDAAGVFFIVAGPWGDIEDEYNKHQDLIWIDEKEAFHMLTYKTAMFLQVVNTMASELHMEYTHVLKTDDDAYVAIKRLESLVEQKKHLQYSGHCGKRVKPYRNPEEKYYVSFEQYPEEYFPPYCRGGAIIMSRNMVDCAAQQMKYTRFISMEDIFVGMLAERCGIHPAPVIPAKQIRIYRGGEDDSKCDDSMTPATMSDGKIVQHHIKNDMDMKAHHTSFNLLSPERGPRLSDVEKQSKTRRLEFVHITKTGGSAIEAAGSKLGIAWGACHYMNITDVGCSLADLPYKAPNYQSYALTSPWHTPPKILLHYADEAKYPYSDADLFAVVRNPYSRILSEYYCPWLGFQAKFRKDTKYEKDPNDSKVMNEWVKSMVTRLGKAMDEFDNDRKEGVAPKKQAKGLNEDKYILAQKHYINQAEYVYDGDDMVVTNILHYENLSLEYDALMKKYDIKSSLPTKEESGVYTEENKKRLSHMDLDPESIALINVFAKLDFEKFGYQMVEKFEHQDGGGYSLEAKLH